MMRAFAVISLSALGLAACATRTPIPKRVYKPSEIVANPAAFRGRVVSVQGYLIFEDGAHGLWDSARDLDYLKSTKPGPDDPAWRRCVTAYYTQNGARAIGRNHPRDLTVTGEIGVNKSRNSIDFGACSDVHIMIEEVWPENSQR
jgi:hypothetical protein